MTPEPHQSILRPMEGIGELQDLGWTPFFEDQLEAAGIDRNRFDLARIVVEHRGSYHLVKAGGKEIDARLSGRLRRDTTDRLGLPAVGDWVAIRHTFVQKVVPRRSRFVRLGFRGRVQVVAANLDVVLVMTAPTTDLSPRRLERYLATIRGGGAEPLVVLNKVDLVPDPEPFVRQIEPILHGAPLHVCSALTGEAVDELRERIGPRRTAALVGSSGVGKSTLLNALVGTDLQEVMPVRDQDERGRHTTVRRELFRLETGELIIDTPGMRELQLFERADGLRFAFPDIVKLGKQCQFSDCQHQSEPGCRLRGAVEDGEVEPERLAGYRRLRGQLEALAEDERRGKRLR